MRNVRRDGVQRQSRVPLGGSTHSVDQRDGIVRREQLRLVMVRNRRQVIVHKFYAPAIEQRSIGRSGYQHRPAAVVRYSDDAAVHFDTVPRSNASPTVM